MLTIAVRQHPHVLFQQRRQHRSPQPPPADSQQITQLTNKYQQKRNAAQDAEVVVQPHDPALPVP